jgi:hypothetical protein
MGTAVNAPLAKKIFPRAILCTRAIGSVAVFCVVTCLSRLLSLSVTFQILEYEGCVLPRSTHRVM